MLERTESPIETERSSRLAPLSDAEARRLLGVAHTVRVARGRKSVEMPAAQASLDDLKGPTGNYRAPLLLVGGTLLVGFQPDVLETLL